MTTMKKTMIIAAAIIAGFMGSTPATAQNASPKGEAIVQVFTNFHSGFGNSQDDRGFELDRAYLGYQYDLGSGLSVKGVVDMGATTDDYDRIAYIKNALVTWKTGNWTFNGGLISTTQFNTVEKFWGYRYIYKSFQDEYKFGSSADLGISAEWQTTGWLSLDAIVVNGEGYKKIQKDDGLQYGLGATFVPFDGLGIRLYAGLNEYTEPGMKNQMNYSAFIGYSNKTFSLGAEYNMMENYKGTEDRNLNGFSVYGTLKTSKNSEIFARYDDLSSKDDWNKADGDEGVVLVGAQFQLCKYIKLAPNFRMTMPKADGDDNDYSAYVSCYFGL